MNPNFLDRLLPMGIAVELKGVMFDGCDETRRVMLEAKGEGYAWALDGADFFEKFKGRAKIIKQMKQQSLAAVGRIVEWHVAEGSAAVAMERIALKYKLGNIKVRHTPPAYAWEDSR